MPRRKTTDEFIKEARDVHGNKYRYDKVEYVNARANVIITCPKHGDFPMLPNNHTNLRHGCPECARDAQRKTTEEFVAKAKLIHGDKYSYDKTEYKGALEDIVITCPKHWDFPQTPHSHLNGRGCPWCAGNKKKTTKEFIRGAMVVHGNKYSYNNVEYINDKTDVFITCPIHGDFPQMPNSHLNGCGCPKCNASHLEEQARILLEKNNITYEPQKKFPWLKSSKNWPMFLDFYLPEFNVAIECHGIQHYMEEGRGYFTKERLSELQQRDNTKYSLCSKHNILIYYIRYDDNIEWKLNKILFEAKSKEYI